MQMVQPNRRLLGHGSRTAVMFLQHVACETTHATRRCLPSSFSSVPAGIQAFGHIRRTPPIFLRRVALQATHATIRFLHGLNAPISRVGEPRQWSHECSFPAFIPMGTHRPQWLAPGLPVSRRTRPLRCRAVNTTSCITRPACPTGCLASWQPRMANTSRSCRLGCSSSTRSSTHAVARFRTRLNAPISRVGEPGR